MIICLLLTYSAHSVKIKDEEGKVSYDKEGNLNTMSKVNSDNTKISPIVGEGLLSIVKLVGKISKKSGYPQCHVMIRHIFF